MIARPSARQLLTTIRTELQTSVRAAVSGEDVLARLDMIDSILASVIARADDEAVWLREEIAAITRVAERVVGEGADADGRVADALADLLKAERTDRADAHGALSSEMKEQGRTHERRASALDDQLTKGHRDLRQQILEQHQQLSDEIRQKADEILATLAREAQQLRSDKTDRSALAALLTEVAMRLNNEFHIPGVEDARNG